MTTCGYIGLGDMGSAMVECFLAAGGELVVHDLDVERVDAMVALGASAAGSAAEVAQRCDVIEVCVPAAHHVEAVLNGPDGAARSGRAGTVVLIHSTVHPKTVVAEAERARAWGGQVFDVCVGGGVVNAREGELTLFVGGLGDLAPEVVALLDVYGSQVIDAGPVGAGAALKIGFNVMTYAQFAAARTGVDLVKAHGADPEALIDAWRHVGQLGVLTERALPLFSMTPDQIEELGMAGFMRGHVELAEKDLTLAREVGGAADAINGFLDGVRRAMPSVYSLET
ncbi:MAG: NAD(P)-binding domain-containing protein [Acidimicrobiia bacterium]|nr:NAD(P)-binding domain-containing protein [Acidimicrobiia bacterium]MDH5237285.1 NAD(P)-binding domain-containing protein [Acidimicrobiia bacterium]